MSNPVPPPGSPAPSPPEQQGREGEEDPLPKDSTTSEPGLRESGQPGAVALEKDLRSRSANPLSTVAEKQELLGRIDRRLDTGEFSPVMSLCKILLLFDLKEFRRAHECVDRLLTSLPEHHPVYALACFWKGNLLLEEHKFLFPQEHHWFEKARQHGFHGATPFVMAEHTGLYSMHSQVKWQNCSHVATLLAEFQALEKTFQSKMSRFINAVQKADSTEVVSQCCQQIVDSVACTLTDNNKQQTPLSFTAHLCHLLSNHKTETAQQTFEEFERWLQQARKSQPAQHAVYSVYKHYVLGLFFDDYEGWFQTLVKHNNYFPQFCAAEIRAVQSREEKDSQRQERMQAQTEELYLKAAVTMPRAFDSLGEFLIENQQMKKALRIYNQGIARINDFLAGKVKFLGYKVGENSAQYRRENPSAADEVDLDEFSTCEELLSLFEAKLYSCEVFLQETATPASVKTPKKKKKKSKKAPPESHPPESLKKESSPPETALQETVVKQSAGMPPSSAPKEQISRNGSKVKTSEGATALVREPSDLSDLQTRKQLAQANRKIRCDREYDEAWELLGRCSAAKDHPLWFKRKQHMAWLYLQQSQDDEYLLKIFQEQDLHKIRNDFHKKARREVREGLNKLVKMCRPDNKTDVLEIPVPDVMAIAEELERKHPGLRTELGSLYSTMGHILKTERDRLDPRTQREQSSRLVRRASALFQQAHRILGKKLG